MRFHLTLQFAQALKAFHEAEAGCEAIPLDAGPTRDAALQAESDLLDALMRTPAGTPEGIRHKLWLVDDRDMRSWADWPVVSAHIQRELRELQRPSATLVDQFLAWRAAFEAIAAHDGDLEDAVGDALCNTRSAAFRAFVSAPCTTPGDFIAKAYVNILENVGGCSAFKHSGPTSSVWDIAIDEQDDERDENEAYQRAAYRDLSDCDLGCCLLTFGLFEFNAAQWIARASSLGLHVSLCIATDGRQSIGCGAAPTTEDPRVRREIDRLLRLAAYPGEPRHHMIAEEIEANWPNLICREPAQESAAA